MAVQDETYLQRRVRELIELRGGKAYKNHGSMIVEPGRPDIFACYQGFFLAIEAKDDNNKPTRQQGIQIRNLQKSKGITCVVWTIKEMTKVLDIIDEVYSYKDLNLHVHSYTELIMNMLKLENIDTGEKW